MQQDTRHQIPPSKVFGEYIRRRRRPYIYSDNEVKTVIAAASELTPPGSVRPQTFTTLITLLYVSGLRISEALALNATDITEDGLRIRATKFSKDRLVPIHTTTRAALDRYLSSSRRGSDCKEPCRFYLFAGLTARLLHSHKYLFGAIAFDRFT